MRKIAIYLLFVIGALYISACQAMPSPPVPSPGATSGILSATATPLAEPSTIQGQFVLKNTSAPGMEVGVEKMVILMEYRQTTSDPWEKAHLDCSFNPSAPVVFSSELVIQYECEPENTLPPNAELRASVEVTIFGSDELFRMDIEIPQ